MPLDRTRLYWAIWAAMVGLFDALGLASLFWFPGSLLGTELIAVGSAAAFLGVMAKRRSAAKAPIMPARI